MRKLLTRTTVLAAALACSPLLLAASPQQKAAPASSAATANARPSLSDELGLTATQRTSVQQLMQQNLEQARPQIQALRQKALAFEQATPGTSQFQTATNDLAQAESTAAHDQVLRQADVRTKVYNLLTPEQRTKLANLVRQRQQQMQQRQAAPPASH
ncbi:MAG TPA: Spy/CpxP family protein refolding chaperone [Rhodanobacteraceae bacterium]|jgi:Spy/CpxP family protein refolding chaperone|nr:Spy/CpxP family protein refolding chaperone [Rhodanobacteraceae bacterium]